MLHDSLPLQSIEDCVNHRNLFLVHVGHGWLLIRATGQNSVAGGAIPLPMLNRWFPTAAMISEIRRIEDSETLQKWLNAGRMSKDELLQLLNKPLKDSGYDVVISV